MKECPLCLNLVESFHKRSHLIPEWMYKDIYSKSHKVINVDFSDKYVKVKKSLEGLKGLKTSWPVTLNDSAHEKLKVFEENYNPNKSLKRTNNSWFLLLRRLF